MEKIFEAALHNQTEVIKDYLKFGNVNLADSNKVSLLHYAAMGNSIEVANLLLDNYANLNVKNSKGETPLFYAVNKGEIGFCRLLCRYGADINVLNENNELKMTIKEPGDIPCQLDPVISGAVHYRGDGDDYMMGYGY